MADPLDRLRHEVLDLSAGRARRHTPHTETALTTPAPSDELSELALVRGLYWSAVALLEGRGLDALTAGRIALRIARLSFLTAELSMGRCEVADLLDVSDFTVRSDLKVARDLARQAIEAAPHLPRIPTPSDRIVISDGRVGPHPSKAPPPAPGELESAA
jgi:hypothetical protein